MRILRALAVATAMVAVALAPTAHADAYGGPYNVTNCTISWGTGPTLEGTSLVRTALTVSWSWFTTAT
jgi:hypothetical protein